MVMDYNKCVKLLRKIQEMDFVIYELALYLDTHPDDEDALNDYNCAVEKSLEYRQAYEKEYGPLHIGSYSRCPWQWIDSPWPWEM